MGVQGMYHDGSSVRIVGAIIAQVVAPSASIIAANRSVAVKPAIASLKYLRPATDEIEVVSKPFIGHTVKAE
jgi:hypothetical protein